MTVAFYGAGLLGSALIRAMLARGDSVRVWNRTPSKAQALESYGALAVPDAAEAADGAEFVHCCLRDDAAVDAVLDAAIPAIAVTTPIVDHSTVLPPRVTERAARCAQTGHVFVHAPVFMGPPMALEARGVMLSSGESATVERIRQRLEQMCSDLRYVGDRVEDAAIFKLMGNAMILAVAGGINDVLRIAEMQKLPFGQAYGLFDFYDPCGQIKGRGRRMAAGDYTPFWTVDMVRKDALLMQAAAHHERLPVIDAMEALLANVADRGLGELDLAAIASRVHGA